MENENSIYADTNQALTFQDLARALDRISQPTEIEDTPLPFDPDDYPVTVAPRTPETITTRILRIIAWGIAILISASILAMWIAFFGFIFWVVINS